MLAGEEGLGRIAFENYTLALATVGVLLTAGIVALAAMVILDLPWIVAFLGASIVSSTDLGWGDRPARRAG